MWQVDNLSFRFEHEIGISLRQNCVTQMGKTPVKIRQFLFPFLYLSVVYLPSLEKEIISSGNGIETPQKMCKITL